MVPAFFEKFKSEIETMIRPAPKALIIVEESPEGETPEIPVALPVDEDGNFITPNGEVLRAIPVEPLELEKEDEGDPAEPVEPPGEALPAIPVEDAPVAIPVEEEE